MSFNIAGVVLILIGLCPLSRKKPPQDKPYRLILDVTDEFVTGLRNIASQANKSNSEVIIDALNSYANCQEFKHSIRMISESTGIEITGEILKKALTSYLENHSHA